MLRSVSDIVREVLVQWEGRASLGDAMCCSWRGSEKNYALQDVLDNGIAVPSTYETVLGLQWSLLHI